MSADHDEFLLRGSRTVLKPKEAAVFANSKRTKTSSRLSQNGLHSSGNLRPSFTERVTHDNTVDSLPVSPTLLSSQSPSSPVAAKNLDTTATSPSFRYTDSSDESPSPVMPTSSRYSTINKSGHVSTHFANSLDMPVYTGTLNGYSDKNSHRNGMDSASVPQPPNVPEDAVWYTRPINKDRKDVIRLSSRSSSPITLQLGAEIAAKHSAIEAKVLSEKETETLNQLIREYFPVTFGEAYGVHDPMDPAKVRPTSPSPKPLVRPNSAPWTVKNTKKGHGWRPTSGRSTVSMKNSVDKMMFLSAEAPTIGSAGVQMVTPYQSDLAQLRMDRLRIEEEHILEVKRQDELERIRGPQPHWYELKTPRFHYEAHKNNDLIKNKENWQALLDYRHQLVRASKEFQKTYHRTDYVV